MGWHGTVLFFHLSVRRPFSVSCVSFVDNLRCPFLFSTWLSKKSKEKALLRPFRDPLRGDLRGWGYAPLLPLLGLQAPVCSLFSSAPFLGGYKSESRMQERGLLFFTKEESAVWRSAILGLQEIAPSLRLLKSLPQKRRGNHHLQ